MPTSAARVTIRETTTTTNMQASVVVINTGYFRTKEGFTKLLILILCIIAFTLVLIESHGYAGPHGKSYGFYAGDLLLLLLSFADLFATSVALLACLLYLSTASLLPKIAIVSPSSLLPPTVSLRSSSLAHVNECRTTVSLFPFRFSSKDSTGFRAATSSLASLSLNVKRSRAIVPDMSPDAVCFSFLHHLLLPRTL